MSRNAWKKADVYRWRVTKEMLTKSPGLTTRVARRRQKRVRDSRFDYVMCFWHPWRATERISQGKSASLSHRLTMSPLSSETWAGGHHWRPDGHQLLPAFSTLPPPAADQGTDWYFGTARDERPRLECVCPEANGLQPIQLDAEERGKYESSGDSQRLHATGPLTHISFSMGQAPWRWTISGPANGKKKYITEGW